MDRPESILTDAETHTLISSNPFTLGLSIARLKDFILQVEKAVIDKLAEQEPVVYRFLRPSTQQYVYITDNVPKTIKEFEPLYAHPIPSVSQMSDKTVCVSENRESEEQTKERHRTIKNPTLEPVFWVRFVSNDEGWEPPIHHSGMTSEMIKSGRYTPLYIHSMSIEHCPDVGKMLTQRQEPVAWRVHPFDHGVGVEDAYAMTQQENQMQAWINKGWKVTPLYLAPTLPLEPNDELIAEVKKIADIRLITGKAELFNVREIIHTIVHHPFAN